MNKPYVKIVRSNFGFTHDVLECSDGKSAWIKNLVELTSYIGVSENEAEAIKCKKMWCDNISETIGMQFTVEDFDKIVTKKDYQLGMYEFAEYKHIVETNIKAVEQGKPPVYGATSIQGSKIMEILEKELQRT
jgi:hypothetical protein